MSSVHLLLNLSIYYLLYRLTCSFEAPDTEDIIDEAISLFRANCFFRNYEIQGPGDRVLIYMILFISECILKVS